MTLAQQFVDWAWNLRIDDIPPTQVQGALLHALDGLGCAAAGVRFKAAPYVEAAVESINGGPQVATLLGRADPVSEYAASFGNGILMHALDFDDTHTAGLVHATAMTLPATLAVAQGARRSGRELVEALVIGYELAGRLGRCTPHGFHARGFHATSVCGVFVSALVAARLRGLNAPHAVAALGIAGSQASGSMEFLTTGASTKQIHPGWSALAGLMAARLAEAGATGPATIWEGEFGLYKLFVDATPDLDRLTDGLGSNWEIPGIEFKLYPSCHLMHRALDVAGIAHFMAQADAIERVRVDVPRESGPIIAFPEENKVVPRSTYEAKFSVQWSVAAMLIDGEINVDTYRDDALGRPDVRALAAKVEVQLVDVVGPAAEAACRFTVVTNDGRTIELGGHGMEPRQDLDDAVVQKFISNVGIDQADGQAVVRTILDLAGAHDLRPLDIALGTLTSAGRAGSVR